MAIHEEESQVNVGAGFAQQTGQAQQAPKKNLFFKGGMFGSPLGNGQFTEVYKKTKEKLTELFKSANEDFKISVLGIDRVENSSLAYSVLLVCGRLASDTTNTLAYHVLLLEATGDRPMPLLVQVDNQQVEIYRTASDAVDDILINEVRKLLNVQMGVKNPIATDVTVVGKQFDPENNSHLYRVARNAALAVGTALEMSQSGFTDINLRDSDLDTNLAINIQFQNTQNEDDVGNVLRSDVMIGFSAVSNTNNRRSLNSGSANDLISEIDGFIDVMWNPVVPAGFNPYMPMQATGMMPTQKYVARMIITNILCNKTYTPAGVLLALYTALTLSDSNNWVQYFRPIHTQGVDLKDIGALAIEANFENNPSGFGSRVDTKSESFSLGDLGKLVAALIQPGLIYSIDVPESGPETWFESVFAAAADGHASAVEDIVNAANSLTNGNFGKFWTSKRVITPTADGRIHMGHYVDPTGKLRDIRDIDYIAVANLAGETNPQLIQAWSDTFTRLEYKEELRLHHRKKIIMALTRETAEITGFARRITFDSNFLEALAGGIQTCGMSVAINTPLSGDLFSNQRAAAKFMSAGLMNPTQSMFNIRSMMGGGFGQHSHGYTRY